MAGSWQLLQPLTTAEGKERLVVTLRRLARSRREFAAWRAWEREVVSTASPALTDEDLRFGAGVSPGLLSFNDRWGRWALQVEEVLSDYLEDLLGLLGEALAPDFVDELGRLVAAQAEAAQSSVADRHPLDRGGQLPVEIDLSPAVPWWRRWSEGPLRDFPGAVRASDQAVPLEGVFGRCCNGIASLKAELVSAQVSTIASAGLLSAKCLPRLRRRKRPGFIKGVAECMIAALGLAQDWQHGS